MVQHGRNQNATGLEAAGGGESNERRLSNTSVVEGDGNGRAAVQTHRVERRNGRTTGSNTKDIQGNM